MEERLIAFACKPTAENQSALADAMIRGTLFVEVDPSSLDPTTGEPAQGEVELWTVETPAGGNALAVYTSKTAFMSAFNDGKSHRYLGFKGDSLLGKNGDKPFALNWGIDPHVVFPAKFFRLAGSPAGAGPGQR